MINYLRDHTLPETLIQQWIALEDSFRQDIIKTTPKVKIVNGVAMPLDGFETTQIDVGSICDGCQQAIEANETVRCHVRLGLTYCKQCMATDNVKEAV